MDTATTTEFDFIAELWKFVRSRFAFQAKQLKHLTAQPLSQCFEVVAISHGFSSWRGMSKVLESMCWIDRLDGLNDWETRDAELPARLSLAIADDIDQIHLDDGSVEWKFLERLVSSPPARKDHDDFEVFEGIFASYPLRAILFYKAAWMGQGAPWSEALRDEAYCCNFNLEELWDGDTSRAWFATKAMYGRHPDERFAILDGAPELIADYNSEVERILASGTKRSWIGDAAVAAYHSAQNEKTLSIANWRSRLCEVPRGSLGYCQDSSFEPSLLMANGPHDAWVSIGLENLTQGDRIHEPVHIFMPETEAYAPSAQKAAQMGACLSSVPSIRKLTPTEVHEAGLPIGEADWHIVHTD